MYTIKFKNGETKTFYSLIGADLRNADLSGAWLINVDLRGANLRGANLSYAYLINADLSNTNLSNAYLIYANLSNTNLRNANLKNADLRGAKLTGANLKGANLRYVLGNAKEIRSMILERWHIAFTSDMAIGCEQHTIEQWRNFSDNEIAKMNDDALEWWNKWKDFIFMAIDLSNNQ